MSTGYAPPRVGGAPPTATDGGRIKSSSRLKRIGGTINGRPSISGSTGKFLSPNEPIPLADQSGMIFPERGPQGAKIALFNDGTWNDAAHTTATSNPQTNVVRLFECVESSTDPTDDNKPPGQPFTGKLQIPIYQAGVGNETQGNIVTKALENLAGGAIGLGISKNVVYSYVEISTRYQPTDEIYILGFSRGGFTTLSVEAFIADVGIIKIEGSHTPASNRLEPAFRAPWDKVATALFDAWYAVKTSSQGAAWTQDNYPDIPNIQYKVIRAPNVSLVEGVFVYDPVAAYKIPDTALGHPITALEKSSQDVPPQVRILRVAYALNEYRYPFAQIQLNAAPSATHRVAMVWWPGDHNNIGGGSRQALNISENTFLFMSQELEASGFRLQPTLIRDFTDLSIGERQKLLNSYNPFTYGLLGGHNIREPLPVHNISRMARMWEEYTLLNEPGIQELLEPIFNPPAPQGDDHQGYEWTTIKGKTPLREWTGSKGDWRDGLQAPSQLTQADQAGEHMGPQSIAAGQGLAVGQDPDQYPNITQIGLNVGHETPHAPTQLSH